MIHTPCRSNTINEWMSSASQEFFAMSLGLAIRSPPNDSPTTAGA
jgi:hypothetical protein